MAPLENGLQLPTELICDILAMLMMDFYEGSPFLAEVPLEQSLCDIVQFSQVCQHWRQAALNFKKVWANIVNLDSVNEWWVKELVHRSGYYPLTVASPPVQLCTTKDHERFNSPKWLILWNQMNRIEILDLRIFTFDRRGFISKILDSPAPHLKLLRLHLSEYESELDPDHIDIDQDDILDLHLNIPRWFQGQSPNLRCLILKRASLEPSQLMDCNLSHLALEDMETIDFAPWLELFATQKEMKALEIELELFGPRAISLPDVSLPNLETFRHRFVGQQSSDMFGHLILPISCNIQLVMQVTSDSIPLIDPVGTVNDMYQGLRRRFEGWANEIRSRPNRRFFWQIELEKECLSIVVGTCGTEDLIQVGSSLELTFEIDEELEDHDNAFDQRLSKAGTILFDILRRASQPIMGYPSYVSVVQNYHLSKYEHRSLINEITLFLSGLSAGTTGLILRGDNIGDFIIQILMPSSSQLLVPNVTHIMCEEFLYRDDDDMARKTLGWYLEVLAQDFATLGKPLPNLFGYDKEKCGGSIEQHGTPIYYLGNFSVVRKSGRIPSIGFWSGCISCPF